MTRTTIITRRNPKTGKIERPYRDRHNNFVLGDPRHGARIHHRDNAVLTADYEKAVSLVRQGFSMRMTAGDGSPPSLISAGKLGLEDVDEVPAGAIPDATPLVPFTLDQVLADLRKALIAEAAMIAYWGSAEAAEAFIGFPSDEDAGEPYDNAKREQVDLSRFRATPLIEAAYDWAFQCGRPERFGPEMWDDLGALMDGATGGVITSPSPMGNPESALRVTIGTAFARWKLEAEPWLSFSVRELAYLAQMTEVAVRNALVKEGIKGRGGVDSDIARRWLQERKNFVPTRTRSVTGAE
jgi:hypothetical protein